MRVPDPQRILVVVLDNIGDLVFSSVLFHQLHARWPGASLKVWCKEYTRDIAGLLPGSPRVFASDPYWHRSPGRGKGSRKNFFRTVRALRRERADLAIVASRSWRAAAATAFLGAARRIGYDGPKSRWFLTDRAAAPGAGNETVVDELNRLLAPLFPPDPSARYRLEAEPLGRHRETIARRRRERCGTDPCVVLHAFAGNPGRCMALEEWVRVARGIAERGCRPLWIGSPNELRRIRALGKKDLPECSEFGDAYGAGTAIEDAALISGAAFFIGHDSGPLHIAAALGIPCLGLYLPSTPRRTGPQGAGPSPVFSRASAGLAKAEDVLADFDKAAARLPILP